MARLPPELQLQVIEFADWTLHPTLASVCRLWRHHITHSPAIFAQRYTYYTPKSEKVDGRTYFHRCINYVTHFGLFSGKLRPCHITFDDDYLQSIKAEGEREEENGDLSHLSTTEFNIRFFQNDPLILPNTSYPNFPRESFQYCVPTEPDYFSIRHRSVSHWIVIQVHTSSPVPPTPDDTIVGLYDILSETIGRRWHTVGRTGRAVRLVKLAMEMYDFQKLEPMVDITLDFATMEALEQEAVSAIKSIVRIVV